MSDVIRCPKCLGQKTYRGIGMLDHKCDQCFALGYIPAPTEVKEEEPSNKPDELNDSRETSETPAEDVIETKRRGRKKANA